ncbi:fluoride efflux transporter FluC [Brevibacterium ravenspurgense]|uniref:fluoride efflux transporter FluC n=1 Tax=Brevibacterium ravenspurgense TaxID=479117 RepID=UPI0007865B29|nr:CrcB family protein [Brevibacterium ravenspurgense]
MSPLVFVAVGFAGGIGAVGRYLLDSAITHMLRSPAWPAGIFAVNVLGSCAAGAAAALLADHEAPLAVVSTGFLGGFTTLSTLLVTVVGMLGQRRWLLGAGYLAATAAACGFGAWALWALLR